MDKNKIGANNQLAMIQEKLARETDWPKIWECVKHYPYYGIIDIQVEDLNFAVLSMNDDVLALQYFWTNGGLSEPKSFSLWSQLTKNAYFVLDVGAYTGYYGIIAAMRGKDRQVFAYEPVSFVYARAASNFIINNLTNIKLENIAISDVSGAAELSLRFGPKLFSSGTKLVEEGTSHTGLRILSKTVSLDELHSEHPVDLIKIDVEGAEKRVLKGSSKIIQKAKPVILLETRPQTHNDVVAYLESFNYKTFLIEKMAASNFLCWHKESALEKNVSVLLAKM